VSAPETYDGHPLVTVARGQGMQQLWQPLVDGRWGRVEGQEDAVRSVGRCHGFWKGMFTSARVNHILRVTKPNTKEATNFCPNSLSQIGAWGLRYNCPPNH